METTAARRPRGLAGWRGLGLAPRAVDAVIYPAEATPSQMAEWHVDRAADHLCLARDEMRLAYIETRRFPRDPRWGRIAGNPVAREHLERARLRLRMARRSLDDANTTILAAMRPVALAILADTPSRPHRAAA